MIFFAFIFFTSTESRPPRDTEPNGGSNVPEILCRQIFFSLWNRSMLYPSMPFLINRSLGWHETRNKPCHAYESSILKLVSLRVTKALFHCLNIKIARISINISSSIKYKIYTQPSWPYSYIYICMYRGKENNPRNNQGANLMMTNEMYWIEKKNLISRVWFHGTKKRTGGMRVSTIRKQREMKKRN